MSDMLGTPRTAEQLRQELTEYSAIAQRAEIRGQQATANAAHVLINENLDLLATKQDRD